MNKYSTVTSKGTITLPAQFRSRLGLRTGQRVQVSVQGQKLVVERAFDWTDLDEFSKQIAPKIAKNLPPVTDVSAVVAEGIASRYAKTLKRK